MNESNQTLTFEAEANQLLNLMIHSLYSSKEIFLRELISNASDALDKLHFEGLTNPELVEGGFDPEIRIETDNEKRILSVSDNGIGMSREETIANLGTIAKSGTKELLQKLKEANAEQLPTELIGEFGVGFYSIFMVADHVKVTTRKAGENQATVWESDGKGTYTISDGERNERGTTVELTLKPVNTDEGLDNFVDNWVLRRIIKKYSDFVRYPIKQAREKENEVDGKKEKVVEDEVLNSMKAIWLRPESDVTEEEYTEFYKHVSNDWTAPYTRITMRAEGRFEYQALLYIPSHAPFDLYYQSFKRGLELYVKNVKILENCEDLLPEYLRFVKGVVDSPDLPLNVSREMLQLSSQISQIRKALTKRVLDKLNKNRNEEADKYLEFFKEFGSVLKEGVTSDPPNKEKIVELLYFSSSNDPEKLTTLADYVTRMKDEQTDIYYFTGESRQMIESSPHLEAFKKKEYEVLFLTDPVDEFMITALTEFEGKKLVSVGKGTVELGTEEEKNQSKKELEDKSKQFEAFSTALQKELNDFVKEVRLSNRLTSSPACLVGSEHDLSPHIERMLIKNKVDIPENKRIMELNPNHDIVQKLKARFDIRPTDLDLADHAYLLFGQALLAEGSPIPDPARFSRLVAELFSKSL